VTKGACKRYVVQDGKFLEPGFTFVNPDGKKSTGAGISGLDPKTNRFTTVWYDSRQTTMSIRQSDGAGRAPFLHWDPDREVPFIVMEELGLGVSSPYGVLRAAAIFSPPTGLWRSRELETGTAHGMGYAACTNPLT
jgi:hypothetical protein